MVNDPLEAVKKVHELFISRKLVLTVAESCTGGLINHLLTELPGASKFLDSGLVTYSVESKRRLLNIRGSLVKQHGIISEEAARTMAQGARELTDASVALSITGNLGPDVWEGKEVGLVFASVSFDTELTSRGFLFDGSRSEIKQKAAVAALNYLHEIVSRQAG